MADAIWANLGLAQCNAGHNGGDRMDAHGVEFHNVELHESLTLEVVIYTWAMGMVPCPVFASVWSQ